MCPHVCVYQTETKQQDNGREMRKWREQVMFVEVNQAGSVYVCFMLNELLFEVKLVAKSYLSRKRSHSLHGEYFSIKVNPMFT